MFKVNNRNIVSIANFEQVVADWVGIFPIYQEGIKSLLTQ